MGPYTLSNVISKANKTLGLIKRNFSKCTPEIRYQIYKTMVRPQLEYASPTFDPNTQTDINKLEGVQNRAARFVAKDYRRTTSVTDLKHKVHLPELAGRRIKKRLITFYDYRNDQLAIDN